MESNFNVGTHNESFHDDDKIACAMLALRYGDIQIHRIARDDREKMNSMNALVDCGLEYDADNLRFDHHMPPATRPKPRENGIPYSSAGLVWRHFGKQIIGASIKESEAVDDIFTFIDKCYIQPIDANDCGYNMPHTPYSLIRLNSGSAKFYNPDPEEKHLDVDQVFEEVVELAKKDILRVIVYAESFKRTSTALHEAVKETDDPRYITISHEIAHLGDALAYDKSFDDIQYVIFPKGKRWRMKAVNVDAHSKELKKALPEKWLVRDEELPEAVGHKDASFCSPSRHMAGANSQEGIEHMLHVTLNE